MNLFDKKIGLKVFDREINKQPFKEYTNPKEDKKHLEWIYNRLIEIHNENPNYDYMIEFKKIINNL